MTSEKRKQLQERAMEEQLKNQKDQVYLLSLSVFGIIAIIIATIITIAEGLRLSAQGLTLYVMGTFLFIASAVWRENNKKRINTINEEMERIMDEEDQSYRYEAVR